MALAGYRVKIASTGVYLPPRVQTAGELASLIGKSEQWILERTGVRERRIAEAPMDVMAAQAARQALGEGPPPDCIINASTTPLQLIPDSAVFVERELGLQGIPCWSIHATCLSFLVGLINAASLIAGGVYKRILIVSAETGTPWRDLSEPESASLFGDAAAAAVVEQTPPGEDCALLDWEMNTWPDGAELTEYRGAGTRHPPSDPDKTRREDNYFHMDGPAVFRMARRRVAITLSRLLKRNNIRPADIDWVIPHQTSERGVQVAMEYGFEIEKVVNIVREFGNCIAASIPMALAIAHHDGRLKRGQTVLLGGTGAGLSAAFMLLSW
jgi:3-oxoacyl-[acyl-carrier-protein] synthase-3